MLQLVVKSIAIGDKDVLADALRIGQYSADQEVTDPRDFASRIFCTVYMGTNNSSKETQVRYVWCCVLLLHLTQCSRLCACDISTNCALWMQKSPVDACLIAFKQVLQQHCKLLILMELFYGAPHHVCCRARVLAEQIGAYHLDVRIDSIVEAMTALFETITGKRPRYRVDGGSTAENLALQNIQVGSQICCS